MTISEEEDRADQMTAIIAGKGTARAAAGRNSQHARSVDVPIVAASAPQAKLRSPTRIRIVVRHTGRAASATACVFRLGRRRVCARSTGPCAYVAIKNSLAKLGEHIAE